MLRPTGSGSTGSALIFVGVACLDAGVSSFALRPRGNERPQTRTDATIAVYDEHPRTVNSARFKLRLHARTSDDDDSRLPKRELFRLRVQFRVERRRTIQRFAKQRFSPGILDDVRDTKQLTELRADRLPGAEPLAQYGCALQAALTIGQCASGERSHPRPV